MSRSTFLWRLFSFCCAAAVAPTLAQAQSYNWIRNPENGHHYAVTAAMTWPAAEAAAVAVGGHLATVRNQAENSWLVSTFGTASSKWIGCNDVATEGAWVWSSGELATYGNWCPGEPNNVGNEDGGLLGECLPLGWSDRNVADLRPGIIEVFGPPCALLPSAMGCLAGVDGSVFALANWDPDGAGPSPTALVIGGYFRLAGSTVANNIVLYDPVQQTWSKIGAGMNGPVHALTVLTNGDLVAGGDFTSAGSVAANHIARWSTAAGSWSQLGTGLNDMVQALSTQPSGQLIVGGNFTNAGGLGINYLARWSPTNPNLWYSIGSPNGTVNTLATLANGDLVIGGIFDHIGAVFCHRIARRRAVNGLWTVVGSADPLDGNVWHIHALPAGGFAACGNFTQAGSAAARRVAIWDEAASAWTALGAGVDNGTAWAVTRLPDGRIVIGGAFTAVGGGVSANRVAAWNGSAWSAFDTGMDGFVKALITSTATGELYAAGTFQTASARTCRSIARWDGGYWQPLCTGINDQVLALTETNSGSVVAGGSFTAAGNYGGRHVAMWNGFDWTTLGNGTDDTVRALTTMPNGDVVAGGDFLHAGGFVLPGIPANYIARWSNGSWYPIGTGMNNRVRAVLALPNGNLIAGGDFLFAGGTAASHIALWNGSSWQSLGIGPNNGLNGPVYALARLPNGNLIVGGAFSMAGTVQANCIAAWNGSAWSALGPGGANGVNDIVDALTTRDDGSVVAGGRFQFAGGAPASRVATWNGTSWSTLATGVSGGITTVEVHALTTLANGHVVAGGAFTDAGGVLGVNRLARWNGSQWTPMVGTNNVVRALLTCRNGELVAGGDFWTAGGATTLGGEIVSPHAVRILTTCPALATPYGTACPGLYGEVPLTLVALPYLGSMFQARASSYGLNLAITGFSLLAPPLPLSLVLPQGVPGCNVLVFVDHTKALLPTNGFATSQIAIPNSIQLVGARFYHQMLLIDGLPAITDVMSTNALTLTIGSM